MYGILDIGSNTIRLGIYKIDRNKPVQIFNKADTVGLAGYRSNGDITEEGIKRAAESINKFKQMAKEQGVDKTFAFATASLRNINNTDYAVKSLKSLTGVDIDVISGEEEAKYDFEGSKCDTCLTNGVMLDIGGGSSEFVIYKNGVPTHLKSMPFGSLTLYNDFVSGKLPDTKERGKIKEMVLSYLIEKDCDDYIELCGVGGTAKAGEVLYRGIFGDKEFNCKELIELCDSSPVELYTAIEKYAPVRIKTLIPGLVVFNTVIEHYGLKKIQISLCGVKEGYLLKKLGL